MIPSQQLVCSGLVRYRFTNRYDYPGFNQPSDPNSPPNEQYGNSYQSRKYIDLDPSQVQIHPESYIKPNYLIVENFEQNQFVQSHDHEASEYIADDLIYDDGEIAEMEKEAILKAIKGKPEQSKAPGSEQSKAPGLHKGLKEAIVTPDKIPSTCVPCPTKFNTTMVEAIYNKVMESSKGTSDEGLKKYHNALEMFFNNSVKSNILTKEAENCRNDKHCDKFRDALEEYYKNSLTTSTQIPDENFEKFRDKFEEFIKQTTLSTNLETPTSTTMPLFLKSGDDSRFHEHIENEHDNHKYDDSNKYHKQDDQPTREGIKNNYNIPRPQFKHLLISKPTTRDRDHDFHTYHTNDKHSHENHKHNSYHKYHKTPMPQFENELTTSAPVPNEEYYDYDIIQYNDKQDHEIHEYHIQRGQPTTEGIENNYNTPFPKFKHILTTPTTEKYYEYRTDQNNAEHGHGNHIQPIRGNKKKYRIPMPQFENALTSSTPASNDEYYDEFDTNQKNDKHGHTNNNHHKYHIERGQPTIEEIKSSNNLKRPLLKNILKLSTATTDGDHDYDTDHNNDKHELENHNYHSYLEKPIRGNEKYRAMSEFENELTSSTTVSIEEYYDEYDTDQDNDKHDHLNHKYHNQRDQSTTEWIKNNYNLPNSQLISALISVAATTVEDHDYDTDNNNDEHEHKNHKHHSYHKEPTHGNDKKYRTPIPQFEIELTSSKPARNEEYDDEYNIDQDNDTHGHKNHMHHKSHILLNQPTTEGIENNHNTPFPQVKNALTTAADTEKYDTDQTNDKHGHKNHNHHKYHIQRDQPSTQRIENNHNLPLSQIKYVLTTAATTEKDYEYDTYQKNDENVNTNHNYHYINQHHNRYIHPNNNENDNNGIVSKLSPHRHHPSDTVYHSPQDISEPVDENPFVSSIYKQFMYAAAEVAKKLTQNQTFNDSVPTRTYDAYHDCTEHPQYQQNRYQHNFPPLVENGLNSLEKKDTTKVASETNNDLNRSKQKQNNNLHPYHQTSTTLLPLMLTALSYIEQGMDVPETLKKCIALKQTTCELLEEDEEQTTTTKERTTMKTTEQTSLIFGTLRSKIDYDKEHTAVFNPHWREPLINRFRTTNTYHSEKDVPYPETDVYNPAEGEYNQETDANNPETHEYHPVEDDYHPERSENHPEIHLYHPETDANYPEIHEYHPVEDDYHPETNENHPEIHLYHPETGVYNLDEDYYHPERDENHPKIHLYHPATDAQYLEGHAYNQETDKPHPKTHQFHSTTAKEKMKNNQYKSKTHGYHVVHPTTGKDFQTTTRGYHVYHTVITVHEGNEKANFIKQRRISPKMWTTVQPRITTPENGIKNPNMHLKPYWLNSKFSNVENLSPESQIDPDMSEIEEGKRTNDKLINEEGNEKLLNTPNPMGPRKSLNVSPSNPKRKSTLRSVRKCSGPQNPVVVEVLQRSNYIPEYDNHFVPIPVTRP
ncbi:hypothetical protein WDU94_009068 [Cyamophila willieti]